MWLFADHDIDIVRTLVLDMADVHVGFGAKSDVSYRS
jgi:hypothetical protein